MVKHIPFTVDQAMDFVGYLCISLGASVCLACVFIFLVRVTGRHVPRRKD